MRRFSTIEDGLEALALGLPVIVVDSEDRENEGDFVIAADSARFTMAYTKIGLSPDGGSSYFLPRIVGMRRTIELMVTNRVLTAFSDGHEPAIIPGS